MTPSESIVSKANSEHNIVDLLGRTLTVRLLTALDKLRLLKAAGPELAMNQPWLSIALLAASVTAIDDVPLPRPTSEPQIEALVERLGDSGIEAVAQAIDLTTEADRVRQVSSAGNLPGTPN